MKEIKQLDMRVGPDGRRRRYSLFECPSCSNYIEKIRSDGLRIKTCSHKCYYGTREGEIKNGYALIPLTQGEKAIVDVEDYSELVKYNWAYGTDGYAVRNVRFKPNSEQVSVRMHRQILNPPDEFVVDHINGNTLDNRRKNLRVCEHKENLRNRGTPANNTSGFKGVSWHSDSEKWVANIKADGKPKYIGTFDCKVDAAKAYNEQALLLHGEFAKLNDLKGGLSL